jgi:hypothetical protein
MTVQELIEQLGYMDKDAEVHFAYNYGDHWRTQVAPKVGEVFEGAVVYSDYHRMDKLVEDDGEGDFDDEGKEIVDESTRRVVVLG